MFKKILFATSATEVSDSAARVAFNIAERYNSSLNLFHVLGVPTRGFSQDVVDVKTKKKVEVTDEYINWVEEEIKTYYHEQLNGHVKSGSPSNKSTGNNLVKQKFNYDISIKIGVPHREILRQAKKINADLIILGGTAGNEEDSAYKHFIASSTLQSVARGALCPVLAVSRPAASFWGGISNIVFGTDFSKASDKAFEFSCKIALALDAQLNIFHALDITGMHMGHNMSQDEIEQKVREILRRMRSNYLPKMKGISPYSLDIWEGIPYVEIVKYAREKQADLIIMAHHSRKLEAVSSKIGSNMEQVIVRAGCPVMSINR